MTKKTPLCVAVLWLVAGLASAQNFADQRLANWHQWRGPEANGSAPNGDPPTEWSETNNIKWKVPIPGRGTATPIIWGDRIFILTAMPVEDADTSASAAIASPDAGVMAQRRGGGPGNRGGGGRGGGSQLGPHKFEILCLDRGTGDTIWRETAREAVPHEGHHPTGTFASASPVTNGQHLYVSFGSRGVYCYDLNGDQKWGKDFGQLRTRNAFGEGASPALYGDTLVLNWDQEGDSYVIAVDAATGNEKWRKPRDERTTWATPLIVPHNGRVQVIMSGENRCCSYDLANGELIWECGGFGPNPIPSPVLMDDTVICMTGFRSFAARAIPLDSTGDVTDSDKIVWELDDGTPYVSSPLLYDGTIYITKDRSGLMTSVDAQTGQIKIRPQRLPNINNIYASPVAAAGRVYYSDREGTTVVLKHGPEMEVLAVNRLDEAIDASPAIVGKEMFVRTAGHLYCIAEPASGP